MIVLQLKNKVKKKKKETNTGGKKRQSQKSLFKNIVGDY